MKIATIAYLQGFGGAEKQLIMLSNALASMGHEVSMFILAENKLCFELSKQVRIVDLTSAESSNRRNNKIILRYKALKNALYRYRPHVTIHFNYQSVYLCSLMNKNKIGKIIYSERGDPSDKEYSGLLYLLRKISLPRIDGFVFQSLGAQSYFSRQIKERSVIIHNPIFIKDDVNQHLKTEKRVVNIGRLHQQKNQELLVRAFKKVVVVHPTAKLDIYGDGELRGYLESIISSLQLNKYVRLLPPTTDVERILKDASVFVLSSDFEGMPNVLLEAMSVGTSCISTDYSPGGVREFIESGINGIVVPRGNESELANSIISLLSDNNKMLKMAEEAKKIYQCHTPDIIYKSWNKYLMSVVN